MQKYTVNVDFFKNPEQWTEKQAYFLGWILSDGHINKKNNCISIKLQAKDKPILEKLKELVEYSGPILNIKRNTCNLPGVNFQHRAALSINCRTMKEDLVRLGFDHKKGVNMTFPKFLRKDLIPHFLRAYIEGDGCISYSHGKGKLLPEFNLIGTLKFCSFFIKYLEKELNINFKKDDTVYGNGCVRIRLSGCINMVKLLSYIYKDCQIFLSRKFKKSLKIINYCKRNICLLKRKPEVISNSVKIFLSVVRDSHFKTNL